MKSALSAISAELETIREAGTWREERIITTPQYSRIDTTAKPGVVNFCANNYLGLSTHPELMKAAKESYDKWGLLNLLLIGLQTSSICCKIFRWEVRTGVMMTGSWCHHTVRLSPWRQHRVANISAPA